MSIEVGLIISIFGLLITYQGYQLSKIKNQRELTREEVNESKDEAKETAQIMAQLGYIGNGVNDIRMEMKDIRLEMKANDQKVQGQFQAITERIARLDESLKSAHKRIDEIGGKVYEN